MTLKRKMKGSKSKFVFCGEYCYDVLLLKSLQQLLSVNCIYEEVNCYMTCTLYMIFLNSMLIHKGYARTLLR